MSFWARERERERERMLTSNVWDSWHRMDLWTHLCDPEILGSSVSRQTDSQIWKSRFWKSVEHIVALITKIRNFSRFLFFIAETAEFHKNDDAQSAFPLWGLVIGVIPCRIFIWRRSLLFYISHFIFVILRNHDDDQKWWLSRYIVFLYANI